MPLVRQVPAWSLDGTQSQAKPQAEPGGCRLLGSSAGELPRRSAETFTLSSALNVLPNMEAISFFILVGFIAELPVFSRKKPADEKYLKVFCLSQLWFYPLSENRSCLTQSRAEFDL
ncbi:hypothetical protein D623_10012285 [Myotis brandtii]|uniref:Uncharacterized protein n=1 Tax=Myotis brandtii TaxID=109478 RepID=S7NBL2_MYOBR|nr:hypothetical protein D623_10012285 [Myotis brandtii]